MITVRRILAVAAALALALPAGAATKVHNRTIAGAPVNVLDYGAKGDGTTDDSAAINAAFAAGVASKRSVYFPAPADRYRVTSPLALDDAEGMVVYADNPQATVIYFDLAAGATGWKIHNGHTVTLRDIGLRGSDTNPLLAVVHVEVDTVEGGRLSTSMRWQNVRIVGGDAYAEYGVLYRKKPGSLSQMNDLSAWYATDIAKTRRAAVAFEDANAKQHVFRDCKFTYLGRGTPGEADGWDDYPTDEGYGVWVKQGSFRWYDGYMSQFKGAAFRVDDANVDGAVIKGVNLESGTRVLDISPATTQPFHVTIEDIRYSAAFATAPGASTEIDNLVIKSANAGVYAIRNSRFGGSSDTAPIKMLFTHGGPSYVELSGVLFETLGSDTTASVTAPANTMVESRGISYKKLDGTRTSIGPVPGTSVRGTLPANLDSIAGNTCAPVRQIPVLGAKVGGECITSLPPGMADDVQATCHVETADLVDLHVCNHSAGAPFDPEPGTYSVRVFNP